MANTKAGDVVENLLQDAHEVFLSGMTAHYKLINQAHSNFATPNSTRNLLDEMLKANRFFSQKGDSIFQRIANTLEYVETGTRPKINVTAKTDDAKFLKSVRYSNSVNGYKKTRVSAFGVITPDEFDATVNYAAQTAAQNTMQPIKQADMARIIANRETRTVYFARIPETGACDFCMMLASRGSVYRNAKFRSHNNCKCTPRASYEPYKFSPEKRKQINDWVEKNRKKIADKQSKRSNEQLVADGLRKRVTKQTQQYKSVVGNDGEINHIPNGYRTTVSYVKTQKATQIEQALKNANTKAFKDAMDDTPKPPHAPNLTGVQVSDEIAALRSEIQVTNGDGKVLNAVHDFDEYRIWAEKMGVLDEGLIRAARYNRNAATIAYDQAVTAYTAEKVEKQVLSLLDRIQKVTTSNPVILEDVKPLLYWRDKFKRANVNELKVALTRAGIIYR